MAGPTRLFVYGTLMPGQPAWPVLAPYAASSRPATAPGRVWDTGRGFPAVRFGGAGPVPGILVELEADRVAEALEVLDRFEDEGRLYRRIEVVTSGGTAFAYEWLGVTSGLTPLDHGWPPRPARSNPGEDRTPPGR